MLKNIIAKSINRYLFCAETNKAIEARKKFSEPYTKARCVMSLYNLTPKSFGNTFIAPNATVIGEVYMGGKIWIGHGAVIRGDINSVFLHSNIVIGDNCVLHTAPSLPSGLPAELTLQNECVISPGCTLYSCQLGTGVFVGSNCVILEGARIQDGAVLLPNSVVPPGRVVPANQVWGGNPIKFVRFAKQQQKYITKQFTEITHEGSAYYKQQFLAYNNAYLYKPSDPQIDKVKSIQLIQPLQREQDGFCDPKNPTI